MTIDQIGIFVLGVLAVFLTNRNETWCRKWAPVCGFAAEPFWFYTGWVNDQWGIVGLAFVYGYAWGTGLYNQWWRPWQQSEKASSSAST